MQVDRAERSRVDEDERASVVEVERSAREARQRRTNLGERPITVHTKVRMEHATIIEVEQLMLATSLHASDARADERTELCGCESATQGRMEQARARDGTANGTCAQHLHRGFDFG
jgi:hypothetical protein